MKTIACAAVAALALGGGAQADPVNLGRASAPNTYFNRPGADMAAHDADLRECLAKAARTSQPSYFVSSPNLVAALVASAVAAGIETAEANHAGRANAENCMVVRGWRVVALPTDQADAIAKLPRAEQAGKLKDWVGAASPPGDIVRQWNNDAADGATSKFERGQLTGGAPNLSFSARDISGDQKPAAPQSTSGSDRYKALATELKAGAFDKAGSGDAVVVIFITGSGIHNGDTLAFQRMGPEPDDPAGVVDGRPDLFVAYDNWVWHKKGQWYAYAVPPGRWRVTAMTQLGAGLQLNFCLGAPAFDANAGEVVYAGAFDLSKGYIGPDLALDPAKAWLGPGKYADGLKPAAYMNGTTAGCGGTWIYDLEFKDAPYVAGYPWGGAAAGRAPAPPTATAASAAN